MIATFIVVSSLVLAALFFAAWLFKPDFRRRVEDPKYSFQEQVERYNRDCQATRKAVAGGSDESS
jgi:hypothetical protein